MSSVLRALRLWVVTSFRASPGLTVLSMILVMTHTIASPVQTYGVKLLVDGFSQANRGISTGVVVIGAAFAAFYVTSSIGEAISGLLDDRVDGRIHGDLLALTTAIPGIAHHEDAQVADRLTLVRKHARDMVGGSWQLVFVFATVTNVATVLILLAGVHPVLLVLPMLASARTWAATISSRLRQEAIEATAPYSRQVDRLIEIASEPRFGTEVRVFGMAAAILQRVAKFQDRVIRRQAVALCRGALIDMIVRSGFGLAYVVAIIWVVSVARAGRATPGDVALVVLLAPQVNGVAGAIASNVRELSDLTRMFGRYVWLRHYALANSWADGELPAPTTLSRGMTLRGVTFCYPGTDDTVLSDVDLFLPAGSMVALVGENGAGKSTLVKLLARLYDPTEGTVLVDSQDLRTIAPGSWRSRTSAGFQDFVRFQFTARESVGIGDLPRIDDESAVDRALELGDADAVAAALPHGLDTQLGARFGGTEPSGGQWQRLALARAFMREQPLLLLLDEPTAALDPEAEYSLFERFAAASEAASQTGGIAVLVSHRFSTVRMADLIVVLHDGRIVEIGSHAALVSRGGRYTEMFELQANAYR